MDAADTDAINSIASESACSEGGCFLSGPARCDGCIFTPKVTAQFAGLDIAGFAFGRTHGMTIASETFGTNIGTHPIAGRLYAFGDNSHGQLGTGDLVPSAKPTILRTCCQRAVDMDGRKYCLKWMDQVPVLTFIPSSYWHIDVFQPGKCLAKDSNIKIHNRLL